MGIFAKIVKWVTSFVKCTDTSSESMKQVEEHLAKDEDKTNEVHEENTKTINNISGNITTIDAAIDYVNSKYSGSGKKV